MDRKTLFFIFGLMVCFYLVHWWFTPSVQPPQRIIEQPKEIATQFSEKKPDVPLPALPLIKLYYDEQMTKLATWAIDDDELYLTFSWSSSIPQYLYVKNDPKGAPDRISLVVEPGGLKNKPVLYAVYQKDKIEIPYLPMTGGYDVYLVYFTDQNQFVHTTRGVAHGPKTVILSEDVNYPAIALIQYKDRILPYGIYDPDSKQVTALLDFPYFASKAIDVFPVDPKYKTIAEDQNYYVLENEYQQLVFTDVNGALVEINLPFHGEKNPQSAVREIDVDRILRKDYPENDYFPLLPARSATEGSTTPSKNERTLGGYYPLLRRSIFGPSGKFSSRVPPHYYALNIISGEKEPTLYVYQLKRLEKDLIEFEVIEQNRRITKTFSFPKDVEDAPYTFDLTIKIEGDARNLFLTPGIPEVELISGNFSPTLKYRITKNQKAQVEQIDAPKTLTNFSMIHPDWICNGNGFFGIILDPLTEAGSGFLVHHVPGQVMPTRLTLIDALYHKYPADKYPGYSMNLPLNPAGGTMKFRVYAGPFDNGILKRVDRAFTNTLTGENPDYVSCQSYHGFFAFISEPFAKFLFFLMNFFHTITHSWGFSIILLTIALRLMLYPLNNWSIKSTAKLQEIAPKVTAIQEKYKKDPKRAQQEIVILYREKKVNPLSGCFPLLIQIPFLIGMFDLLKTTFELRGVPFIPGWIDNLTAPDVLFSWNYPIIFFGNQFHLLPVLLGVVMYIQQKFTSLSTKSMTVTSPQQKQQKMMGNIMTIVFTVMFYHFPSGLNIYWLSSMLLGILQQWWTMRKMKLITTSS